MTIEETDKPGQYYIPPSSQEKSTVATFQDMNDICEEYFGGYAAKIKDQHELDMVTDFLRVRLNISLI